jgi:hypothetical protein
MRCLNCGTVVADSDPACRSCGAQCTTPVRDQDPGLPVPYLAALFSLVGMFSYPFLNPPDHPIHDREIIQQKKTEAYVWGLIGAFLGSIGDGLLWTSRRRQRGSRTQPSTFGPDLNTAFRRPEARVPGQVQLQTLAPVAERSPQRQPVRAASQWEEPSRQRSVLVRVIFGTVWAVVFFIAAALVSSTVASSSAGDDPELRKRLTEEAGQRFGMVFFLGSIVLAVVLGKLGMLPGTRRLKR